MIADRLSSSCPAPNVPRIRPAGSPAMGRLVAHAVHVLPAPRAQGLKAENWFSWRDRSSMVPGASPKLELGALCTAAHGSFRITLSNRKGLPVQEGRQSVSVGCYVVSAGRNPPRSSALSFVVEAEGNIYDRLETARSLNVSTPLRHDDALRVPRLN